MPAATRIFAFHKMCPFIALLIRVAMHKYYFMTYLTFDASNGVAGVDADLKLILLLATDPPRPPLTFGVVLQSSKSFAQQE